MKLKKLELINTRGIVNQTLEPNGQNMGIYGPNGQGKSAVIDGLDFLLTGTISRLVGEGGRDLSLKKHGPNVTVDKPEHAIVRGTFVLGEGAEKEEAKIERSFADPDNPIITASTSATVLVNKALQIAKMGQHILTRREILQFITATGNDRATKIQSLLKLQQTEQLRGALKNIQNKNKTNEELKKGIFLDEKGKISALVVIKGDDDFEKTVLDFANKNRNLLGAQNVISIGFANIFDGVKSITQVDSGKTVSPTQYISAVKVLDDFIKDRKISEVINDAISLIRYKESSDIATTELEKQVQIVELALNLIVEGKCPLCEVKWDINELRAMLEKKKIKLDGLNQEYNDYADKREKILITINPLISSLDTLNKGLALTKDDNLYLWHRDLNLLHDNIEKPLSEVDKHDKINPILIPSWLKPKGIEKRIADLNDYLTNKYPKTTPEQDAWDTLTQLRTLLSGFESAKKKWNEAESIKDVTDKIYTTFESARDEIVQDVYDSINTDFMEYYKFLNGEDENNFKSKIKSDGAGVDFKVDFYGYGENPPHALHSEGHQDSMGICIFLALSKKFSENILDIVMLDDVVMSVDSDHRGKFAELLKSIFSDKQFIITTHDKIWFKQLINKNVTPYHVEFHGWSPTTGPNTTISNDWKAEIRELIAELSRGEDGDSVGRLRKILEEEFLKLCQGLNAKTVIKLDLNYTVGDLIQPAIQQLQSLIRQNAAVKKGKVRTGEDCQKMLENLETISKKLGENQWMLNPATHYTEWDNFTLKEKIELIELYEELLNAFYCSSCGVPYHVDSTGKKIQCDCDN